MAIEEDIGLLAGGDELVSESEAGVEEKPEFVIGGVNSSETIRGLIEINWVSVEGIERAASAVSRLDISSFLDLDKESLLGCMEEDNDYVLSLGLEHKDLAEPFELIDEAFGEIKSGDNSGTLEIKGYKYSYYYYYDHRSGSLNSPFNDRTSTLGVATLTRIESDGSSLFVSGTSDADVEAWKSFDFAFAIRNGLPIVKQPDLEFEIGFPLKLAAEMIKRYGFYPRALPYEGAKSSLSKVGPEKIVAMFPYLKERGERNLKKRRLAEVGEEGLGKVSDSQDSVSTEVVKTVGSESDLV